MTTDSGSGPESPLTQSCLYCCEGVWDFWLRLAIRVDESHTPWVMLPPIIYFILHPCSRGILVFPKRKGKAPLEE